MLVALLGLSDCVALAAYDGSDAMNRAGAFCPDIVFLDLGMARMDGYEVARRMRATEGGRDCWIVALTAWDDAATRRRVRDAGIDLHLVKPAPFDQVLRAIEARR